MKALLLIATCFVASCCAKPSVTLVQDDEMTVFIREDYLKRHEGRGNMFWTQMLWKEIEPVKDRFHIKTLAPVTIPNQIRVYFDHDKDENDEFIYEEDAQRHKELQANLASNIAALEWVLVVRPHNGEFHYGDWVSSVERTKFQAWQKTLRTYTIDELETPAQRNDFHKELKRENAARKQARKD